MSLDFESLGLTEIIRLQDQLSRVLARRFEKSLALAFTDVVGSTAYFAKYGDEAGRGLQQRHVDLLMQVLPKVGGRIVDTAGDGAFTCFPAVEAATDSFIEMQTLMTEDNAHRPREHQLVIRTGIHWGNVLTDGTVVTGDSVNMAARVASTANPGEMRLTRPAFLELSNISRLRCKALPPAILKGIDKPVELMDFQWRDLSIFPSLVRVEESGEEISLPPIDTISFGRLKESEGMQANDVVLSLPDEKLNRLISRWHFELRRRPTGFLLRSVSDQVTEVDGQVVAKGSEVPVRAGSVVRLGKGVTLTFVPRSTGGGDTFGGGTVFVQS